MALTNNNKTSLWIQPYKLICPTINKTLLQRERLFSLLNQGQMLPVTSVSAPAGFGKSALLVSWLQQQSTPYCWYSLDANDNDASYFANHLMTALYHASAGACPRSYELVQQQEYTNLTSLLSKAMMELAQLSSHCLMVLDDVQVLRNPQILEVLRHWLKALPPQLHVVLLSQTEPDIALSTLRVKGQVLEIGSSQLAFQKAEVAAFLSQNLPFDVSHELVDALFQKTNGWPAALQLLTHNATSVDDISVSLGRLGQGSFEIDAFLEQEVMQQQPEKISDFLMSISVLEQFNSLLCGFVARDFDSEAMIFELEQRQLFIDRVQGPQRWYRLQDIFRNFLIKRLRKKDEARWQLLQQDAVLALLRCNMTMEAVQLSLQLNSEALLIEVVQVAGVQLYQNGRFETLTKLFDRISNDSIESNSELMLMKAWVLLATYRENEVMLLSTQHMSSDHSWIAEYNIAKAQAANNEERFEQAKTLANEGLKHLRPSSQVARAVGFSVLGQSALCQGQLKSSVDLLLEAERLAYDSGLVQQRLWSMCLLSDAYTVSGQLKKATDVQLAAINMAHDCCIEDVLHMEFLYRNRIHMLIESGDLLQAEKWLLESERVIDPLGHYGMLNIYVHRGLIALWRGQNEIAKNFAFQVGYLLDNHQFHTDWLAHAQEFLLACSELHVNQVEDSLHWQEEKLTCAPVNHFYQHYQRNWAIEQYRKGNRQVALAKLDELMEFADQQGLMWPRFKCQLLYALWQNDSVGLGHWMSALSFFSEIKPLKSIWLFGLFSRESLNRDWPEWHVWFGQHAGYLDEHASNAANDQLLQLVNERYAVESDLITPKELQVLLYISEGLNNDEIAATLHIAVSTVKSHIRRLYRKLGISKRAQAIALCRRLQ